LGGKLEAFYYAFGDRDIYTIADFPDNVTAAAASMVVTAAGTVWATTVVLITAEEMDEVSRKNPRLLTSRPVPEGRRGQAHEV
jgi:uncharacterized protein with GYD domain